MRHRCDRTLIEYKDQMKDENAETNCLSLHSGNKTVGLVNNLQIYQTWDACSC